MNIKPTTITDSVIIETDSFVDVRGAFTRLFCENDLVDILGARRIVQINHSRTVEMGSVRGLHLQKPPCAEMKLVTCVAGKVWDVILDLRSFSESYLQWHAEILKANDNKVIVVPEGCAHGFQVLEGNSELMYFHTEFYNPKFEVGVRFDDEQFNIDWPVEITNVSQRDKNHADFDVANLGALA